jgi:hypothetical protein
MRFNVYIDLGEKRITFLLLYINELNKVIAAYQDGKENIFLRGKTHLIDKIIEIQIYAHEKGVFDDDDQFYEQATLYGFVSKNLFGDTYLNLKGLAFYGKKITDNYIKGEFGYLKKERIKSLQSQSKIPNTISITPNSENSKKNNLFISSTRIVELSNIKNSDFDLTKLIKLCQELNDNYSSNNFITCAMICRTILNHVPPIFDFNSFDEVANNYGGPKNHQSFKKNISHLNNSLKNIADRHLHSKITNSESLPNETQVDFKQDLDVLLEEICRLLKNNYSEKPNS